ncbi:hypothetical protein F3J44_15005 [Pantoea sp. Tr-811]|uniref:hypothetical protein n=1 Tax=Pantoea sp. Tr-811 TaxID=2608361 RepID=UPI00141E500D|nr:hypothetical protein [Pantoea sp. Tr-811]NIF27677.1 hypothetical protein [Pantoea sp. Tr-811]
MDHNWGAGRGNGGLDGGYIGSIDHAISNLHVGRRQGREAGHQEGFDEGQSQGYAQGWDAGAACANEKLAPLRAYVRQYFEEAVELRAVVQRQQTMIDLMYEQLSQVAKANAARAEQQADASDGVAALKSANQLLQARVDVMDGHFKATVEQSNLRSEQYQRTLVFTRAVHGLLEALTAGEGPDAQQLRQRFVEHYQAQVAASLRDGDIQLPPEQDVAFEKQLPVIQQFIVRMQQSAAPDADVDSPDPAP